MSKLGSNIFSFITGLSLGAVFGILYAPDKGSNTRDKVTFRLERYREKLEELLDELVQTNANIPDSIAKSDGEKVINDAREKAKQLLTDVDLLIEKIKSKEENEEL